MPSYAQVPTATPPVKPLTKATPDQPGGMFTNFTVPQPVQPGQIQAPNLPPSPGAPPFNWTAPTVGAAPTPTPYGTFTAPTLPGGMDPYQFRVDQANKGAQRSAAAHGTLLSGGFQQALAKLNQGLASEEEGNIYNRARDAYTVNRDTNQQNFGQQLGSYTAGTGAALDAGRLGLAGETAGYDRRYGALRDTHDDAVQAATMQAGAANANTQSLDAFRQAVENARAATANQQPRQPMAQPPGSAPQGAWPTGPRQYLPPRPLPGAPGAFGRR